MRERQAWREGDAVTVWLIYLRVDGKDAVMQVCAERSTADRRVREMLAAMGGSPIFGEVDVRAEERHVDR